MSKILTNEELEICVDLAKRIETFADPISQEGVLINLMSRKLIEILEKTETSIKKGVY